MEAEVSSTEWVEATTVATGLLIGALAAVATFSGTQTWYAPLPTLVLIPAFFVGLGAPLFAALAFYAWNYQLFLAKPEIPIRSFILFVLFANLPRQHRI